jgi:hypothetical protein
MKLYYLIETTDSERGSSYKKICETLEEAEKEVMNYADWYCAKGCCKIVKVDSNFNRREYYKFWKGELDETHTYRR